MKLLWILCLALFLSLPLTLAAQNAPPPGGAYISIVPQNKYPNGQNDPNVAGECLPIKNGWVPPVFGKACRIYAPGNLSNGSSASSSGSNTSTSASTSAGSGAGASGSGSSSGGVVWRNSAAVTFGASSGGRWEPNPNDNGGSSSSSSGADTSSSGSTNNPNCPVPGTEDPIPCDDNEECAKDCVNGTPICLEYDENCGCTKWETPQDCHCKPKCDIPDPNYPFCCKVADKSGYPCLKVCTLPSGDTVDIEQNPPICRKFSECCYGKREDDGSTPNCSNSSIPRSPNCDPVETEPGDPRDYCKMKCVDVCEDKQAVQRTKTSSDIFPECCTPPIPISIACACCRDGTANKPASDYCEYFFRFFSCDDATLACPSDPSLNQCVMTVDKKKNWVEGDTSLPEYDPNHDPYLTFDPRFSFCQGQWNNRNCRYICRGQGILTGKNAPTMGIWVKDYIDNSGKPIENNYALEVEGNCTDDQGQAKPIPWPPGNQHQEKCGDPISSSGSSASSSSGQ
jgi:hypothetical protein